MVNIPFSPALLEMAMARFGIAAAQLKSIDTDAKKAIFRFFIQALQSGDANAYIKEALAHLDAWSETRRPPEPEPPAPSYRATSRPIGDNPPSKGKAAR